MADRNLTRRSRSEKKPESLNTKLTKMRKLYFLSFFLFIVCIIIGGFWIRDSAEKLVYNYPEVFNNPLFYVLVVSLGFAIALYLFSWKTKISLSERIIIDSINYRAHTTIKEIAKAKKMTPEEVRVIVSSLIERNKIQAELKDDSIIIIEPKSPVCGICHRPIYDIHIMLVLCPFCKRPYHKEHILEYINTIEKKCPECKHALDLRHIYI